MCVHLFCCFVSTLFHPVPTQPSPLPVERKPEGGFGVINCVNCRGKDHVSANDLCVNLKRPT